MTVLNATHQLIKSYTDKVYKYTTTIVHRGTVVAFAMDESRRIYYSVLNLSMHDAEKGNLDSKYWPEDPSELLFPNEVEQVGYSLIGATPMPIVKKGGRLEADPATIRAEEVNRFLSTTSRLTADAPFHVFSDNVHVFVFRQSLPTDHPDMVYKLKSGGASGSITKPESEFVLDGTAKVPIVDSTLLCDRFILATSKLCPKLEVRYQRSRHKTQPSGANDTLGVKDMEGRPFYEPTQELAFVKNLRNGHFTVLQLPTQVSGVKNWQIFSHNSSTKRLDSFNLEVSSDGLFNPAGTQLYTSPDPKYKSSVLERKPGKCPFTGSPLVPLSKKAGHAMSCLHFRGSGNASCSIEPWTTKKFTLELWAKCDRTDFNPWTGLFSSSLGSVSDTFQLDYDGNGRYRFLHKSGYVLGKASTNWQHIAVSYDGSKLCGYLDGSLVFDQDVSITVLFRNFVIGSNRVNDKFFEGMVDEVRVWEYDRTKTDIVESMNCRLVGNELGLKGYYRFDEGAGNVLIDHSGQNNNCDIHHNASWVASGAPIGEQPSIRQSSFALVAADHLAPMPNLAMGKPTKQSTTASGQTSSFAVDGNTSVLTQTSSTDASPWWWVDLQMKATIGSVKVFGKTDKKLNKFKVEVLDSEMELVTAKTFEGEFQDVVELKFDAGTFGNFVKVSNFDCGPLCLAQVEVYGLKFVEAEQEELPEEVPEEEVKAAPPIVPPVSNLALGKPTQQSTTGYNLYSSNAVDGSHDGNWGSYRLTHTAEWDSNPWWWVNLQAKSSIESITIYGRTDTCQWRLNKMKIQILDADMKVVTTKEYSGSFGTKESFTFGPEAVGNYVRIYNYDCGPLTFAQVEVYGSKYVEGAVRSTNLARGKPTKQSTTLNGLSSSLAVNGNVVGNWAGNSVAHTLDHDPDPWWWVNLEAISSIQSITIYGRTDGFNDRINRMKIQILDADMNVVTTKEYNGTFGTKESFKFGPDAVGNYVRISNYDCGPLTLVEVEVYGVKFVPGAVQITNVALGKPTKQSSTSWGGYSSRAVDGDREGRFFVGNLTHTAEYGDPNPWWWVNLQAKTTIRSVRVYGRTCECQYRLNKMKIEILDADMGVVTVKEYRGTFPEMEEFDFGEDVVGNYVRISNYDCGPLTFAQVEVYGSKVSAKVERAARETALLSDMNQLPIDHSGHRTVIGGLSASLYYQQEEQSSGYDGTAKPMKKNARVMLSVPTVAQGGPDTVALAALDFGVSRYGRLVQVPDSLTLPVLEKPKTSTDPESTPSSDIALHMKHNFSDPSGLTLSGALLAFAQSGDAPYILDSATGNLTTYFRNKESRLMASHLDVNVRRARFELKSGTGMLFFLARGAGSHLDETTITITDGTSADRCNLIITNPALDLTEDWRDMPRDVEEFASIVNGHKEAPAEVKAKATPLTYSLHQGSTQVIVVAQDVDKISNGEALSAAGGSNSKWIADAPGQAHHFNGADQILTLTSDLDRLVPDDKLTIETWVNKNITNARSRLVNFNGQESAYFLGLEQATSTTSFEFDGNDRVFYPLAKELESFSSSFCVECWVCFKAVDSNLTLFHVSKDEDNFMVLHTNDHHKHKLQLSFKQGYLFSTRASDFLPKSGTWYHVSCSWDAKDQTCRMYIDGNEQLSMLTGETKVGGNAKGFALGAEAKTSSWKGSKAKVDEVRIWNDCHRQKEVESRMYRRAFNDESGLLAYYTFEDGEPADSSRNGYHGTIAGDPRPVASSTSLLRYHLVAGVSAGKASNHDGKRILRSTAVIDANHWNHLAFAFQQSYALSFNGGDNFISCGSSVTHNLCEDLTIELFLKVPQLGRTQGLISKGRLGQRDQSTPYQLSIERDGKLCFTFEDNNGKRHDFRSTRQLRANTFHRIAVSRKKGMTKREQKGTTSVEMTNADGHKETKQMDMIESFEIEYPMDITFYIDGNVSGVTRFKGGAPSGNDGDLEFGRTGAGAKNHFFQGVIAEVRLWEKALPSEAVGKSMEGNETGLAGWWRFEERKGNVAIDSKCECHGKIQGASRVKTCDPEGGVCALYINGMVVDSQKVGSGYDFGDEQFSIGGVVSGGTNKDLFNGILEEIRIWNGIRSGEQLLDNLFSRLKGEKEDLIAYYTFDQESTNPVATALLDDGLRGCDIPYGSEKSKPSPILSTAPISNDASIVRSALIGVDTEFQIPVDSTPSVQEYADMQRDSEGQMFGVMKRCYSYLRDGKWNLYTGYKVGSLVAEWIGQAQFDPQVVGFVEGCPPLPSENLTDGAMSSTYENYAFIATLSNLELVESDSVSYNVSSSKEGAINGSFDVGLRTNLGDDTLLITAPLGFGIAKQAVEVDFEAGISGNFEGESGWASEQSYGSSINKSKSLSVGLGGTWEPPEQSKQLNPVVGRRLIPGNMGFALVQSETADIFAMRMSHNKALVSFKMQPNPDIPKDWNLIPFPINPRYIKQGTLDGRVGYDAKGSIVLDPDYSDAQGYGEYSYFKPREAYALKKQIQREQQQLLNYYDEMGNDHESEGSKFTNLAGKMAKQFVKDMGLSSDGMDQMDNKNKDSNNGLPSKFSKRNLVNTYVWTADGGFFAETTETTDVRTESASGSFSFNRSASIDLSTNFEIFSIGLTFEFEAAMGGSISTARSRDKESEKSFSLEINVDPPGDLQIYKPKSDGLGMERIYDDDGNGVNAAGKVDAYRFMSFYLDSDKNNFEDLFQKVVDPVWLAESDHPNAIAMRQANQSSKKPACWRVMHRVTFVSRLLPEFTDNTEAPPLDSAMKAAHLDSNWQLIKKLEPLVRNKTGDEREFRKAVHDGLAKYLPELSPHAAEVTAYLKLYFGMEE